MTIIHAENLGIRFRLHREKRKSVKGALVGLFAKSEQVQDFWALREVGFNVNKGEVLGVIGKNGSGKSTLLRVIGGIFAPDEGNFQVQGSVSTLLSIGAGFQPELSGIENIYLNGILTGFSEREVDSLVDKIVEFSELGRFVEAPVKTYSSGMYARLGFSIAIHLKRDIMLIDEVLGVGDATFNKKCRESLKNIMREGRTVVLISHNMDSIKEFSRSVLWLENGRVKAHGSADEIVDRYLES